MSILYELDRNGTIVSSWLCDNIIFHLFVTTKLNSQIALFASTKQNNHQLQCKLLVSDIILKTWSIFLFSSTHTARFCSSPVGIFSSCFKDFSLRDANGRCRTVPGCWALLAVRRQRMAPRPSLGTVMLTQRHLRQVPWKLLTTAPLCTASALRSGLLPFPASAFHSFKQDFYLGRNDLHFLGFFSLTRVKFNLVIAT